MGEKALVFHWIHKRESVLTEQSKSGGSSQKSTTNKNNITIEKKRLPTVVRYQNSHRYGMKSVFPSFRERLASGNDWIDGNTFAGCER